MEDDDDFDFMPATARIQEFPTEETKEERDLIKAVIESTKPRIMKRPKLRDSGSTTILVGEEARKEIENRLWIIFDQ